MSTIDTAIIKALVEHIGGDSSNIPEGTIGHNVTAEFPLFIDNNKIGLYYNTAHFEVKDFWLSLKPSGNGLYTYYSSGIEPLIIRDNNTYNGQYCFNKVINMKHGDIIRLYCRSDGTIHSFFITDSDNLSQGQFKAIAMDNYTNGYDWFYISQKDENSHYEPMESDFFDIYNPPASNMNETMGGYYILGSPQLLTDLTYLIKFLTKNNA